MEDKLLYQQKSALVFTEVSIAVDIKVLEDVKGIGFVKLSGKDVIRHKLVMHIISAYEKYENK